MVVAAAGELSLAQVCDSPCEKYLWDLANAEQKVAFKSSLYCIISTSLISPLYTLLSTLFVHDFSFLY